MGYYRKKEEYIKFFNDLKEVIDLMLQDGFYPADFERYLYYISTDIEKFRKGEEPSHIRLE
jgi:hypothetical protein